MLTARKLTRLLNLKSANKCIQLVLTNEWFETTGCVVLNIEDELRVQICNAGDGGAMRVKLAPGRRRNIPKGLFPRV